MKASPGARAWLLRIIGLATATLFLLLVARFWHPVYGFTSFLQLDASNDGVKIAAFKEHPVFVYRDTGGYDGLYYAQIAYHPLLTSPELAPAMDDLAYRARRILPPLLAWTVAWGNPAWIVHVYSLLNVAAWLALAVILWRLLAVDSLRAWLAWAGVMFSAGALSSVRLALTDLIALALLAGALLAVERGRGRGALGILAASGLARESSLLALAGLVERPWWSRRNCLRALVALAPLAGWMLYVGWRVGGRSFGWYNFTWPVAGLAGKWLGLVNAFRYESERLAVWTTLLATVGLCVQGAYFLVHRRPDDRWWRIGLGYTALMLWLGAPVWLGFPGAATRVLLPLNLAFNVLAHRVRAPLIWLLAGNLSVFAGLLALGNVPHDPREIAAARGDGTACVAQLGAGWFNQERNAHHQWAWSGAASQVDLRTWGSQDRVVRLEFLLRSLTERTVFIRDEHGEIWRGRVGPQKLNLAVTTHLTRGRGRLEFGSLEPAVLEKPEPGGRSLAFALYDARLHLTEP